MDKSHNMDTQPHRDFDPRPDTDIMYREMVRRNQLDRERISEITRKRLSRQNREEEIKNTWDHLSQEQQEQRIETLTRVCNDLIRVHPNYKQFKKARVFWPVVDEETKEILVVIHWNGKNFEDASGWGMVDREFPAHQTNIVIKRYQDRLSKLDTEDEL